MSIFLKDPLVRDLLVAVSGMKSTRKKPPKQLDQQSAREQQKRLASSLIAAAGEGKVELVCLLLRCGADVNAQDEQHQFAALHSACQQGHNQVSRVLLAAGARPELKNSFGDTPLHTAARYGHAGVARILLSARSNPNQVNKNHDTPLHIAAAMGRRKLTKIFMQSGAEPAIKNKQNETAMDIALRKDLIEVQELIANPPPPKERHSRRPASPSHEQDGQLLSRLERRYGQLYGSHNPMSGANQRPHQRTGRQHRARPREVYASTGKLMRHRRHLEERHSSDGEMGELKFENELAVDVGALESQQQQQQLVSEKPKSSRCKAATKATGGLFASVHSLTNALASRDELLTRKQSPLTAPDSSGNKRLNATSRLRTKTIGGASDADLNLLPALISSVTSRPAAAAAHPSEAEACLAPDARPRRSKSVSPMGSLRSSCLSRPRGRALLVRRPNCRAPLTQRKLLAGARPALVLRRPSGTRVTSVGAKSRAGNAAATIRTDNEENPTPDLVVTSSRDEAEQSEAAESQQPHVSATGRRQERLSQKQQQQQQVVAAPNGTQLVKTQPLAPLSDDSQLYAIPRKSKANTGSEPQVVDHFSLSDLRPRGAKLTTISEATRTPPPADDDLRVPSGGPALTSDEGGNTSAASSTSSGPELAPPSAEPSGQLVGVRVERDLQHVSELRRPEAASGCTERRTGGGGRQVVGAPDGRAATAKGSRGDALSGGQSQAPVTTKLRQLLHLESRASRDHRKASAPTSCESAKSPVAMSAVAGGYFAYSPVVPTINGDAAPAQTQVEDAAEGKRRELSNGKKSWLRSKFSLSSAANQQLHSSRPEAAAATAAESQAGGNKSLMPAELMTIDGSGPTAGEHKAPRPIDEHDDNDNDGETATICNNEAEQTHDTDERSRLLLIRPKSALSSGNVELIRAQRSLAQAAAAKVKQQQESRGHLRIAAPPSAEREREPQPSALTVKTTEHQPFWHHHLLHHRELMTMNQSVDGHLANRSGTNSAGMSDSSPSNNGAESDNSIQTSRTSASVNTSASEGQQQQPRKSISIHNPGLFGVLSSILLNGNKSQSSKSALAAATTDLNSSGADSSGSTLKQQAKGGSLSSSPGSSSTSSAATNATTTSIGAHSAAGLSPNSSGGRASLSPRPLTGPRGGLTTKLDQLSSRSRCPIVVARSNELMSGGGEDKSSGQPPRLPAKGVLKSSAHSHQQQPQPPGACFDSLASGLPRVSSCGQIPAMPSGVPFKQHYAHPYVLMQRYHGSQLEDRHTHSDPMQASLCNYHALSRSQPFQAQYSPYLPYALGRYSIHEPCDPAIAAAATGSPRVGGEHELGDRLDTSTSATIGADDADPSTAVNYEYYFDGPSGLAHHFQADHLQHPARYHQEAASYHRDDSIYIPYVNGSQVVIRDASAPSSHLIQRRLEATNSRSGNGDLRFNQRRPSVDDFDGMQAYASDTTMSYPQQSQLRQRPKSSLDTYLLSSSGRPTTSGAGLYNNGHYTSSNAIDVVDPVAARVNGDQSMYGYLAGAPQVTSVAGHSALPGSYAFYTRNNSIYASNHDSQLSELTVLPASATTAQSAMNNFSYKDGFTLAGGATESPTHHRPESSSTGKVLDDSKRGASQTNGTKNSLTPTPYKSLVHVNQSSPTIATSTATPSTNSTSTIICDKVNQSSSGNPDRDDKTRANRVVHPKESDLIEPASGKCEDDTENVASGRKTRVSINLKKSETGPRKQPQQVDCSQSSARSESTQLSKVDFNSATVL